jgi:hypothetical protein
VSRDVGPGIAQVVKPLANFWLGLRQALVRQRVTVELGRIFMGDHPGFVVGERPQNVFHDVWGVWPGAISVGIVGLE